MQSTLSPYFTLYRFPTGRRLFALQQVRERAERRGEKAIVGLCEEAIAQDQQTRRVELLWRKSKMVAQGTRAEAKAVDHSLDLIVSALYTQLKTDAKAFAGEARGDAAAEVVGELFPDGVVTVIRETYENELAMVEEMVERLEGDLATHVDTLGIPHYVTRLSALAKNFHAALTREETRDVDYDDVRAAREQGQEAMLRVFAAVLGKFNSSSDSDVEARHDLLLPILSQNERIADYYSRRRGIPDVDPESGDELLDSNDDEPTPGADVV